MGAARSRGVHDASWPGPCVRHPRVQRVLRNQLRRRHRGGPEPGMGRAAAKTAALSVTIGGRGHLRPGRDPGHKGSGTAASLRFPPPSGAAKNHERPGVAIGLLSWAIGGAVLPSKRAGRRVVVPVLPAIPRSKFCRNRSPRRIPAAATKQVRYAGHAEKPGRGGARQRLRPIREPAAAPLPALCLRNQWRPAMHP